MNEPLRIAIAGTKHPHSRLYQETLAALPEVQVVGVWRDDEGDAGLIEAFRTRPQYASLDALLAGEAFDAAMLFVPSDRAQAAALQLIAAGKHLYCDKPVCRSAAELLPVAEALRGRELCFAAGYQNRFRPVVEKACALMHNGAIGRTYGFACHLITTSAWARGPEHYLFSREHSGGGVLHWLGCHLIDLLRDVTGREVAAVAAMAETITDAPIDVEDVAALSLALDDRTPGTLLAGYVLPMAPADPYRDSSKQVECSMWGERGRLWFEPFGSDLRLDTFDGPNGQARTQSWRLPPPAAPGYDGGLGRAAVLDFVTAVRAARPPRSGVEGALRALEVLDAVYASAATGRRTAVEHRSL
ncbi:MAG TPA: Gfo/Idh/MocA family oxidoreductase [Limnochordia bacterium]|nr:Gfo/Idh/MocA family oxidoreductase [Limnochordia bacterium]